MKLNFSNEKYKKIAMQSKGYSQVESKHSITDAFMLLIKGVEEKNLSNFCRKIQEDLEKNGIKLTIEECYNLTQGKIQEISMEEVEAKDYIEKRMLDLAYECIEVDKKELGDFVLPNNINTSSWISHSLYEAKAAQQLAQRLGLDTEKAGILGMLHDYGRKYTHDFTHVILGYEALVDEGWIEEARASITHSFINAGRCANCDPAEDGFYIDENGQPAWEEDAEKDDITEVLENLEYDDYDMLLNIADLIATSDGITTPYDRVQDVATRKKPDIRNRGYFLSEFSNKLIYVIENIRGKKTESERLSPLMDLDAINSKFKEISEEFYNIFTKNKYINNFVRNALESGTSLEEVEEGEKGQKDKNIVHDNKKSINE